MIKALSTRAMNHLTIVKPETVLSWQRRFIKNFWSYKHKSPDRKSITKDIKTLILEMKQENYLWGCKRIANELKKINIDLHYTIVPFFVFLVNFMSSLLDYMSNSPYTLYVLLD
jgi:transposase